MSASPATVESIDPANGEVVDTFEVFTPEQIEAARPLPQRLRSLAAQL
jgi:hypothetical protein